MACKGRAGEGSYSAQIPCNSIAVVWVMQLGGDNKGMIDSCTHKNTEPRMRLAVRGVPKGAFRTHSA